MATLDSLAGTVRSFDDDRGLGVITAVDGSNYPFHCTQIADGSRTIAVDTEVSFTVIAGRQGRWEAGTITAV